MTHIAIDGNEANVTNRVGSNVYAYELLIALEKLLKKRKDIHVTVLLAKKALPDLPKARQHWRYRVVTPAKLWTQWALPLHLFAERNNYHVFFTPGHYAPRISSVPYVSSVMDLAFLHFPKQFKKSDYLQLRDWTKYSVNRAKKIITISAFSKAEIIENYGKREKNVIVAYPALPTNQKPVARSQKQILKKFGVKHPYIVAVNTLQPRKNLVRLIRAYEQVAQKVVSASIEQSSKRSRGRKRSLSKIGKLQLVIAGKVGWLADDIVATAEESSFHKDIILTGFVSDEEKQALLKNALVSASVGLYEGFGIPALESLDQGVIPVVSNVSSLPEVVGKAGILVNPMSKEDIANGLEEALELSGSAKTRFRKEAKKQLKEFSWEESAKVVLETLLKTAKLKA